MAPPRTRPADPAPPAADPAPPADPAAPPAAAPPEGDTVTVSKADLQKMIDDAVSAKVPAPGRADLDREARYSRADLEDFAAAAVAREQARLPAPAALPGSAPAVTPVPERTPTRSSRWGKFLFGADPEDQ